MRAGKGDMLSFSRDVFVRTPRKTGLTKLVVETDKKLTSYKIDAPGNRLTKARKITGKTRLFFPVQVFPESLNSKDCMTPKSPFLYGDIEFNL